MISAPSAAPRDIFPSPDIHDNLILYTHINCKDARDLHILVFVFGFFGGFALGFIFGFLFLFCCLFLFLFFVFCLVLVFCDFVILTVVAYCTQLLSQAMYNLMMAAMAETCSC